MTQPNGPSNTTRRQFLRQSGSLAAGATVLGSLAPTAYAGEDNTGRWFDERWPDYDPSVFIQVVESRQPSWARGPSKMRPEKDYYEIERVRLPLASDGETVDMIMALTVFFDSKGDEILTS